MRRTINLKLSNSLGIVSYREDRMRLANVSSKIRVAVLRCSVIRGLIGIYGVAVSYWSQFSLVMVVMLRFTNCQSNFLTKLGYNLFELSLE